VSIKDAERVNRGSGSGLRFHNIAAGHRIRQWRSFLSEAKNKTILIEFIIEEWKSDESKFMIGNRTLFVACVEQCWKIDWDGASLVNELQSSQEEADTKVLLHAKHASQHGFTSVIIVSEDTDVFVLRIAFVSEIGIPLYQKMRTKTTIRYMDIKKTRTTLGDRLTQALIGYHAFTGCDSVSAFSGQEKVASLKLLRKNEELMEVFIELGQSWTASESLISKLEEFTCQMYAASSDRQSEHCTMNSSFRSGVMWILACSLHVRTV